MQKTVLNPNADEEIRNIISTGSKNFNSQSYSWLEVNGKTFHKDDVFVSEIKEEPTFARIENIYKIKNDFYFYAKKFDNLFFDTYYHAYQVDLNTKDFILINVDFIPKIDPCILVNRNSESYIVTRYDL